MFEGDGTVEIKITASISEGTITGIEAPNGTTLKENMNSLLYVRSVIDDDKRVALTCYEKDPKQCHRSRVANALMQLPYIEYNLKLL